MTRECIDYKSRKVRVFLSSTFRDMEKERDYLMCYIFPQVHEYCKSRNLEFFPIDLRWGITEESGRNGMVLNACLNEIDDSRPFFVGILGMRYGWVPSIEELNVHTPSLVKEADWIINQVIDGKSITEMEMDYAVLRDMDIAHAAFFIRSENIQIPDDHRETYGSDNAVKLAKLKTRILKQSKYPVSIYGSVEEMGKTLYKQLISMVEAEYPPTPYDGDLAEIAPHEQSLLRRSKSLCGISSVMEYFDKWISENERTMIVTGASGAGASTQLSYAIAHLRERYDARFIYFDFDSLPPDSNPIHRFKHFCQLEENRLDPTKWACIAIDNLTSLSVPELTELSDWISDQGPHLHIMMSMTISSVAYDMIKFKFRSPTLTLHSFNDEMTREFIKNYLIPFGKQLTDFQLQKISSTKVSSNPTYLTLMLDAIVSWGDFATLDKYIDTLVKHANCGNLFWFIVGEVEQSYIQANMGKDFVHAMMAISMVPEGISERNLMEALGMSQTAWSAIKPGVLRFCKGNDDRMMLVNRSWCHDVKMRWASQMHIRVQLGKHITRWAISDERRKERLGRTLASIYQDIYHLNFTQNCRENKDAEKYEANEYQQYVSQFAFTYRNVISITGGMLCQIMAPYLHNGTIITHITDELQNILNGGSVINACEYVNLTCRTLIGFQYGKNTLYASRIYAVFAEMLTERMHPFRFVFEALSFITIGKVDHALKILDGSGLLTARGIKSLFSKKRKFEGEMFLAHALAVAAEIKAFCLIGDFKRMQQSVAYIGQEISLEAFSDFSVQRPVIDTLFSSYFEALSIMIIHSDSNLANQIREVLGKSYEFVTEFGLMSETAYYFSMASAILFFRGHDVPRFRRDAYYALKNASAMFGVNDKDVMLMFNSYSLQYNRAANLYAIAEYKESGRYMNWENKPFQKAYGMMNSLKEFCGVEWKDVDAKVRAFAYSELQCYINMVKTIEPESVQVELDNKLADVRTRLLL